MKSFRIISFPQYLRFISPLSLARSRSFFILRFAFYIAFGKRKKIDSARERDEDTERRERNGCEGSLKIYSGETLTRLPGYIFIYHIAPTHKSRLGRRSFSLAYSFSFRIPLSPRLYTLVVFLPSYHTRIEAKLTI